MCGKAGVCGSEYLAVRNVGQAGWLAKGNRFGNQVVAYYRLERCSRGEKRKVLQITRIGSVRIGRCVKLVILHLCFSGLRVLTESWFGVS